MDAIVRNNQSEGRFEIEIDGAIAELTYRRQPDSITFLHTGVPPELEGRGLAKQLAVAGLGYARENGLSVVPLCPFVATYIKRHPEYADLVRESRRSK